MTEPKQNNIDRILYSIYGRSSNKSHSYYAGDGDYEDFQDYIEYIYDKRN